MAEEIRTGPESSVPVNDNGDLIDAEDRHENVTAARLDRVVLDIARLIGRQLARDAFEVGQVANDNRPGRQKEDGRGPDGEPLGKRREDQPP
ncbi:hypothetical protein [Mesorhizobium sp. 128a]